MIVDYIASIMGLELEYPGSFHDVRHLHHLDLHQTWHAHFTHIIDYSKYLLGDFSYQNKEIFIMRWIGWHEFSPGTYTSTIQKKSKKMYAGHWVCTK